MIKKKLAMKNLYIIANWKMNPTTKEAAEKLSLEIIAGLEKNKSSHEKKIKIVICLPFCWLDPINQIRKKAGGNLFALAGQNAFWENEGAYTGEISPLMLKNLSCDYVLIGHSERKKYLKEDYLMMHKKLLALLRVDLRPVLVLNPKKETLPIFEKKLKELLAGVSKDEIEKIIFVYEPTEAISTEGGKMPAKETIIEIKSFIKNKISEIYREESLCQKVVIIYGGNVSPENAREVTIDLGLDGALIGANSLLPQKFLAILKKLL